MLYGQQIQYWKDYEERVDEDRSYCVQFPWHIPHHPTLTYSETLITARAEDTQHGPKGCITVRFKNCDYIIVNEPPKRRIQKLSN